MHTRCATSSSKHTKWKILRIARTSPTAAISARTNCSPRWIIWHAPTDSPPSHTASTPTTHLIFAPGIAPQEIRTLSRRAGLPTWDRPASACLASRVPYGTEVTPERLALIERGESALRELGFRQFRVRMHDNLARVEISQEEMPRALSQEMAAAIAERVKAAGFAYVALDLQGYRQGSLNEALAHPAKPFRKTVSGT